MTSSQQSVWGFVRDSLQPGMAIRNWTADKGYIGEGFTVREVRAQGLEVEPPQGRKVPAADFEIIGKMWSGYLAGGVQRSALRNVCQNTKYVISILHQLGYQQPD